MKEVVIKEPVTIRFKQLKNGNQSIYLDIYKDGKRVYEFLKLYLVPEVGREKQVLKQKNKETMVVANVIKSQRILDIKNGMAGIESSTKGKMNLFDYMDKFARYKRHINPDYDLSPLTCIKNVIIAYKGKNILIKDIDRKWCIGFIEYLNTAKSHRGKPLSKNTIRTYYRCFSIVIKKAAKDGFLQRNPLELIDSEDKPNGSDEERVYLTLDEVKMLEKTPCRDNGVKRAFMFSCFCGLRISDVRALRWDDLTNIEGEDGMSHYRLSVMMKKTKRHISYLLSNEAIRWLPEKGESELVFDNLCKKSKLCIVVKEWVKSAGINKYVTFHTARHTFATMMLTLGADIYTTSKLLGHSKIQTTEIYAKIVDKKKDEAMELIDKFYDKKEKAMKYYVYYNNICCDKEVAEFDTLRQAKSYCNAMNNGKQPYTPGSIETHHCYEVYRGEVEDDSEPIWGTDWFFD